MMSAISPPLTEGFFIFSAEKQAKQLRKAVEPADYEAQVAAIFRDLPLREQTVPDWC